MEVTRSRARFTLILLFAINLLNFFDRHIITAVVEPIRKLWGLTDSQIGWLVTAFTLLYAVVGVPLGRLTDRWNRPRILTFGVALWSLLTAASGMAWNYGSLLLTRLGVGIGEASCAPAANSLIGDLFPVAQRARALSFFMLGLPIGGFLGTFISGRLAAAYGWRVPFYVACIPGLVVALLALLITDPSRGAMEASPYAGRTFEGSPYGHVLRIPTMRWIILSGALHNFNMYVIATFLPAFLSRYHSLNLKQSSAIAATVFNAMGLPGLLIGGWAADRLGKKRHNGRLLVAAVALLLATPCLYFALLQPAGALPGFVVLMGAGCLLMYIYYSGVYAAVQDVVQPSLRGTAMALYFFAMYLLGGSFGPVVTGKLSDYFARRAMLSAGAHAITEAFRSSGLHSAMFVIPLCSLILSLVLFAAARIVISDMLALQRWMRQPQEQAGAAN